MSRRWVCNASPLISLSRVGRLDLLSVLAEPVLVPATVLAEVKAGSDGDSVADHLRRSALLRVVPDVAVPERVARWQLDPGETQVLSQALAVQDSGVVLDDLAARRCARVIGLRLTGTVGVVALAKRQGLLTAAAPVLDALVEAGLYVAPSLLRGVLAELGESA